MAKLSPRFFLMSESLPTYDRPPVVEVALSVSFRCREGLTAAHLGAFWSNYAKEFPKVETVRPIPEQLEEFETSKQWLPRKLQFSITEDQDIRVQMMNDTREWMRQIQSDRIVVNWRKQTEAYPRFSAAAKAFREHWDAWLSYLDKIGVRIDQTVQWEVAYVNQIPKGSLWATPEDWPRILPGLWGDTITPVPRTRLKGLIGQWVWDHQTRPARLFVEPRPGSDEVMLYLTARGSVERSEVESDPSNEWDSISRGIECGHELIVTAFDAIVSDQAKEEWKRHE